VVKRYALASGKKHPTFASPIGVNLVREQAKSPILPNHSAEAGSGVASLAAFAEVGRSYCVLNLWKILVNTLTGAVFA